MKKILFIAVVLCVALSLSSCLYMMMSSDPAQTEAPKTEPSSTNKPENGGELPSEFVGWWVYQDGFLEITDEGTWTLYDDEMAFVKSGACRYDEGAQSLVLDESANLDFDFLRFDSEGALINSASDVLHPTEKPSIGNPDLAAFIGTWKYDDRDVLITIYENSTWNIEGDESLEYTFGECRTEKDGMLVLSTYGGFDVNYLRFNDDGVLCDSVFDTLSRYDESENASGIAPFVGRWEYDDKDESIVISSEWEWERYDGDMNLIGSGSCSLEEGYGLVLHDGDNDVDFLRFDDDGFLYDSAHNGLTRADD